MNRSKVTFKSHLPNSLLRVTFKSRKEFSKSLISTSTSWQKLSLPNTIIINTIMQVKNDLRNNDLESFKNIVNSTNDTHNKLISSIQKNVDQMIRDKSQQEGVTMAMEEKISKISVLRFGKNIFQAHY